MDQQVLCPEDPTIKGHVLFTEATNLPVEQQTHLMLNLLLHVFDTGERTSIDLLDALGKIASKLDNEVGIRVCKAIHDINGPILHQGIVRDYVRRGLALNENSPSDINDWLVDNCVEELFMVGDYEPLSDFDEYGNSVKDRTLLPMQRLTIEQIRRAMLTYDAWGKILDWTIRNLKDLPVDLVQQFSHRWINKFVGEPTSGLSGIKLDALNAFATYPHIEESFIEKAFELFENSRVMLLAHEKLPQSIIDDLCQQWLEPGRKMSSWEVEARKKLLANPRLDESYLWMFYQERAFWEDIAKNPKLPFEMAKFLVRQEDKKVAMALLHNPGLDPELWNKLAHYAIKELNVTPGNAAGLIEMAQCSNETLHLLWSRDENATSSRCAAYMRHPSADTKLLVAVIGYGGYREVAKTVFRSALAIGDDLPEEVVEAIARRVGGAGADITSIRLSLCEQKNLPIKYLKDYAALKTPEVAEAARKKLKERETAHA